MHTFPKLVFHDSMSRSKQFATLPEPKRNVFNMQVNLIL